MVDLSAVVENSGFVCCHCVIPRRFRFELLYVVILNRPLSWRIGPVVGPNGPGIRRALLPSPPVTQVKGIE